jgi:hypothetical protein
MTIRNKKPAISSPKIKFEICGIIFTTEQDKEQHKKLEHKDQRPTVVSWVIFSLNKYIYFVNISQLLYEIDLT